MRVLSFTTAVQEERTPIPTKQLKLSTKRSKSTSSVLESARDIATLSVPFPFYSFGPAPINIVNALFNNDAQNQAVSTSMMIEILAKAEEAEIGVGLPSPVADRKVPESTRISLLSVMSWSKSLPMFTHLPVEDQIEVIRESWMDVNTLKLLQHIIKFPIGNDIVFKADHLAHLYLTDNPVVASSIQKLTKHYIIKMQDFCLSETELSCLKLISLMNPCEY